MATATLQLNVRVSQELDAQIRASAAAAGKTLTAIVIEALTLYFNHDHQQGETNK